MRVRLGRHRHGQRAGDRIDKIVAAHPAQIDHLRPPQLRGLGRRPPEQIAAARLGDEREHQVAVGVEVVRERSRARGIPAVRGCPPAPRCSASPDRRGDGCLSCAAPRSRSHRTPQQRSIGAVGRQRRRHHPPPGRRHGFAGRGRSQPFDARQWPPPARAPETPAAEARSAARPARTPPARRSRYAPTSPAAPPTPTILQQEIERKDDQSRRP